MNFLAKFTNLIGHLCPNLGDVADVTLEPVTRGVLGRPIGDGERWAFYDKHQKWLGAASVGDPLSALFGQDIEDQVMYLARVTGDKLAGWRVTIYCPVGSVTLYDGRYVPVR